MQQFERFQDFDGDGATECTCNACRSQGRLDQGPDCRHYVRPALETLPVINWARRHVN